MFIIPATRESRPVAVLLGGSRICPTVPAHADCAGVVETEAYRPRAVWLRFRVPCRRSLIMPISLYRRRIAATVIQLAGTIRPWSRR